MAELELDPRGVVVACPACGQKNRLAFPKMTAQTRCGKCQAALAAPASPVEAPDAASFDAAVAASALPLVVDFWAPWCGPCRMVAPELERVASRNAGRYLIVKVNTDAVPEIVADGETGILVSPGDGGALVAALDRLIASAELRASMGRAARRKIERDADPAAHRERLVALIREVAQHHG